MRAPRRWGVMVPGIAVLACVGVWLGHTLEYARVWGLTGIGRELTGSVHLYMLPLGLVLTALLAGGCVVAAQLYRRLGRRADQASQLLSESWRRTPSVRALTASRTSARWTPGRSLLGLWGALACVQILLYLVQENVETVAAGAPAPGLSPVSGIHWAAPILHVVVAFVLSAVTVGIWSLLRRRQAAVERFERAVHALLLAIQARRGRAAISATTSPSAAGGCAAFLGASIWCRPPPLMAAV